MLLARAPSICCLAMALLSGAIAGEKSKKPPVPVGRDPGGVVVAIIGSGIDYLAPTVGARLARDGEGEIVGFDLVDRDRLPFRNPAAGPIAPCPLSPRASSVILNEASAAALAVFRVADGNLQHAAESLAMVAQSRAGIVLLENAFPAALNWAFLREASVRFPDLLIVVPADSDTKTAGRSQETPQLGNVLVVSAMTMPNAIEGPGPVSIDLAAPAPDQCNSPDFAGSEIAAARIAALAARLVTTDANLKGMALKTRIIGLAKPFPANTPRTTKYGWIEHPLLFAHPN